MPLTIRKTIGAPIYTDYEYEVNDKDLLAEMICQLILGNNYHIQRVIKDLAPDYPEIDKESIRYQINQLKQSIDVRDCEYTYKIDGWLFQFMSWIVLVIQHKGDNFKIQYPHSQPAMQGIDGLAITLHENNTIERIIITEDKCTTNPRKTILEKVFPEFSEFDNNASKNNALQQQIQSLIGADGYIIIQNDIKKKEYRQYRIGITREDSHNSQEGRNSLFKGYDSCISGTDVERRTGDEQYELAEQALRDFLSINHSKDATDRGTFYLGETLLYQGKYQQSLSCFLRVQDRFPDLTARWIQAALDGYQLPVME